MIVDFYKKLLGRKFFYKIFIIYSLVTICAILLIAYMALLNMDISLKNREKENNEKILSSVNTYFQQKIASSRDIIQQIYTNNSLYSEVQYLIENGYSKHLRYKIDRLLTSTENKYSGFESYFNSCCLRDKDIIGICIYSDMQTEAFIYSGTARTLYSKDANIIKYLDKSPEVNQGIMIIPAHDVHYLSDPINPKDTKRTWAFTVVYQVKDSFSPEVLGYITIDYSIDGFKNAFNKYLNSYKGTVLILSNQGETIFDSSNSYYSKTYPFFEDLKYNKVNTNIYKNNIVNTVTSADSGVLTAAVLPQNMLLDDKNGTRKTIIFISFACVAATLLLTYITMLTFSKRIGSLMAGIKNIKSGDFLSRIIVKNKQDEISEIAMSFNNMCDHINKYIEIVYISDIKQKNAQIKALQAKINPHFIYNTLESIRMRALVKGARDVSEMIYLLSSLFRSSVKEKLIISIQEEIKHCEMYLELFNMRFMNRVKVTFDIKEDTFDLGIIKHSIQPIIENYVLHGIDTESPDNLLTVRVFQYEGDVYVYVIDNGIGIEENKLNQLRQYLINLNLDSSKGIGLTNVNERIMLLFGSGYGIDLISEQGKGTAVMIKYPARMREEMEKGVQSIGS